MHEVLETGVEVCLFAEGTYAAEVGVVDVGVDPEQALEYGLHYLEEVGRERVFVALRKEAWIVNLQQTEEVRP